MPAGCHLVAGSGEGPAPLKEFLQPSSLPTLTSQPQRPRLESLQGLPRERDAFVQIFVHFAVCFLPMFRPHQPLSQEENVVRAQLSPRRNSVPIHIFASHHSRFCWHFLLALVPSPFLVLLSLPFFMLLLSILVGFRGCGLVLLWVTRTTL